MYSLWNTISCLTNWNSCDCSLCTQFFFHLLPFLLGVCIWFCLMIFLRRRDPECGTVYRFVISVFTQAQEKCLGHFLLLGGTSVKLLVWIELRLHFSWENSVRIPAASFPRKTKLRFNPSPRPGTGLGPVKAAYASIATVQKAEQRI